MQTAEESFPTTFDEKEVTFRMLYTLLKKHKEYKFQRDTPHESCTCEICENVHLFVLAINRKLKKVDKRLPTSVKDLVKEFSCDIDNAECMKSKCGHCAVWEAGEGCFLDDHDASSHLNSDDSGKSDDSDDCLNGLLLIRKRTKSRYLYP